MCFQKYLDMCGKGLSVQDRFSIVYLLPVLNTLSYPFSWAGMCHTFQMRVLQDLLRSDPNKNK